MKFLEILDINFEYNGSQHTIHPVILHDNNELVLVDCGYPGFLPLIEKAAAKHNIDLTNLTGIIITHNDMDHTGGLYEVKEKYPKAKVYTSAPEAEAVSGKEKSARLLQAEAMFPHMPEDKQQDALAFQQMLENIKAVDVDHVFEEKELLPFCGGIEIVSTPGHTPGHISLYLQEIKTLIAGDVLVYENGAFEIANPHFTIDLHEAVKSVKKLLAYDIDKIVCYHGGLANKNIKEGLGDLIKRYAI